MLSVMTFVSTGCEYQGTQPLGSAAALRPSDLGMKAKPEAGNSGTLYPIW